MSLDSEPRSRFSIGAPAAVVSAVSIGGLLGRALLHMHSARMATLAEDARRVLERHPYSIAVQSRLLAPALVLVGTWIFRVDFATSFVGWIVVCSVAIVVVQTVAARSWLGSWGDGVSYAALLTAAVLLMQDRYWLELWDLIDLIVGTLFAYAIFTEAHLRWFVALFAIALVNRESALFIPLWLVLSALPARHGLRRGSFDRRFWIGLGGLAVGLVAIAEVRSALFRGDRAHHGTNTPWGNHFKAVTNVFQFVRAARERDWRAFAVYAALACTAYLVVIARPLLPGPVRRVPVLLACMAGSIFLFAVVLETRAWLFTIPFLLFIHGAATRGRA